MRSAFLFWCALVLSICVGCSGDDGPQPLTPDEDGLLAVIDVPFVRSLAFSPGDSKLALHRGRSLELYLVRSGRLLWHTDLMGVLGSVYSPSNVTFSHNGLFLAAGPLDEVQVVDVIHGRVAANLEVNQILSSWRSIAFGVDDRTLYVGSQEPRLTVWDWPSETLLRSVPTPAPYSCNIVVVSPDGRTMATGGFSDRIALWSLPEILPFASLDMDSTYTTDFVFAPSGRYLAACGSYRSLHLWDLDTRKRKWVKTGLTFGSASSLSINDDGLLATNLSPTTLAIIDVETGEVLDEWPSGSDGGIGSIEFNREGTVIAVAGHLDVRLWDVATRLAH